MIKINLFLTLICGILTAMAVHQDPYTIRFFGPEFFIVVAVFLYQVWSNLPTEVDKREPTLWESLKIAAGFCNWRVNYPEGGRSRPMRKSTAKAYASMFNGQIEPTLKPILDIGLR